MTEHHPPHAPSLPRAHARDRVDALARVPINLWPERLAWGPARSWRLDRPAPIARARSVRGAAMMLAAVAILISGCYRVQKPPPIGEPVRVVVVSNDSRLVQAQAYIQNSIAEALVGKLGWQVSPAGSARLELTIEDEAIGPVAKDARDITVRWSVRVHGRALLVSRKGNLTSAYTGVGYATGMNDETEAMRAAADNAAFNVSAWLETAVKSLH